MVYSTTIGSLSSDVQHYSGFVFRNLHEALRTADSEVFSPMLAWWKTSFRSLNPFCQVVERSILV